MTDIRLPIAETMFALRVGIICVQDGKLLVVTGDHLKFKYSIGGAVTIGEETAAAAAREWQEETGLEARPLRLVGVVENFFELTGQRWHEVGFYYEMTLEGTITIGQIADQPNEYLEWLPLEKLAEERVYPEAIGELLNVPAGEIRHLVQRSL